MSTHGQFHFLIFLAWSSLVASSLITLHCTAVDAAPPRSPANKPPTSSGGSQTRPTAGFYPKAWSTLLEDVARLATILAIVAAGAWAYFNFVKGRLYRPCLELDTSGVVTIERDVVYLLATTKLKNVGLSKVPIQKDVSAIRLFATEDTDSSEVHVVDWSRLATYGIFDEHGWFEPGEVIRDQNLFVLPKGNYLAFRIEARVVSCGKEWNAIAIVTRPKGDVSVTAKQPENGG